MDAVTRLQGLQNRLRGGSGIRRSRPILRLIAKPGELPLRKAPRILHCEIRGRLERHLATEMRHQLRGAERLHHREARIEVSRSKTPRLLKRPRFKHSAEAILAGCVERFSR